MSNRPVVYESDGQIVYRASSLGSCTKALVAARLGYESLPTPSAIQELFDAGHDAEAVVLEQLAKDGWKLYDEQAEVGLSVSGKIAIVGHIDAKGYYAGEGWIVEVKSQSQVEYDAYTDDWTRGLWPRYSWQTSVYQLATELGLCLVRYNRDSGEYAVSYHITPRVSLSDIRRRVLAVEAQAATGELPSSCDSSDYPCPVFYLHDEIERTHLTDPAIDRLADEYKQAQIDEKAAKGRKQAVFKALRERAGDNLKIDTMGGYKVTFFYAKNRPSYQIDKATDEDKAVFEKYKVQTESLRLKITPPKEDDDERASSANSPGVDARST